MKTLKFFTVLLIVFTFLTMSCQSNDDFMPEDSQVDPGDQMDDDDDASTGNLNQYFGSQISRDFFGQVVNENNIGISGATVKVGAATTTTDDNGIFSLANAQVNEKFGYLRITAPGYVTSGRAVRPTDGTNKIKMMLLSTDVTATVNSGAVETVNLPNGTSVTLAGDYMDSNGDPYSGPVAVILDYLDPASDDLDAVMPGMLYAEDADGDERYLQTFGMISVELRDPSGNELNIDPTAPAELRFPLDANLQGAAPATIPLWSFEDTLGYWIEEGQATLQGNEYVGMVSHFSFWNCDAPFPVVDFCTTVTDVSGVLIANATVSITYPGNPYPRTGTTDASGQVCGKIPAGQVLTITVNDLCGNSISTSTAGPFASAVTHGPIVVTAPSVTTQQVVGVFNDCSNAPVTNGYVIVTYAGDVFYDSVTAGTYAINVLSCPSSNSFTVEGIDLGNVQTSGVVNYVFTPPVTNLSTLTACNAVTEYIEYTVAGASQKIFITDITAGDNTGSPGFYISAQTVSDYFYVSGNTTTTGVYPWAPPGLPGFIIEASIDLDYNLANTISFQLNAYGAIGGYIDLTFNGTYTDTSGNPQTITGSLHVVRDF
ncbi:MAG: hypothetical protein ACI828_002759 [Flavobacteriales bacterium]|jgi:hypothetical protein